MLNFLQDIDHVIFFFVLKFDQLDGVDAGLCLVHLFEAVKVMVVLDEDIGNFAVIFVLTLIFLDSESTSTQNAGDTACIIFELWEIGPLVLALQANRV